MTVADPLKPAPRSGLVDAVRAAEGILDEALPLPDGNLELAAHRRRLRVAAMPVLLRELLDVEADGLGDGPFEVLHDPR